MQAAGDGTAGYLDGIGTNAKFNSPSSITIDQQDKLYVAEYANMRVRSITPAGVVTTFAGSGTAAWADGYGTSASFSNIRGLHFDGKGNLFVTEEGNNRLRVINSTRYVSTFAGSGVASSFDGQGTYATFNTPFDIKSDLQGNLYLTEYMPSNVRRITPSGAVTKILGTGTAGYADGSGISVSFNRPYGLLYDQNNVIYVSDLFNYRIRKIVICPANAAFVAAVEGCICSQGYYKQTDGSCSNTCPIGTEINSDLTVCSLCSLGKYKNSSMTACGYCPAGAEPASDRTSCILCTTGKYRSDALSASCSDCPIGTQSASNFQSCTACPAAKYRPSTLYPSCDDCPLFSTCNTTQITSCLLGYKINAAGNGCEQCPIGAQSSSDCLSCVSCTVGTNYRSSLAQAACVSCPANAVCSTESGFTCNAGYEPTGDGLGCAQCQDGYSKSASANTACTQCSIGTESAADKQSCANCAVGYYRSSLAMNKCIPCPTGATCTTSAITRCPNGYKKNSAGDGCDQCPIVQDSSDGLNCQACTGGFFKPAQSYQMCVKCPDGSPACSGSSVSCQIGYYFDSNVQCKRNDTYFALMQTATNTLSTVTSYLTVTQVSTQTLNIYATATVSNT